MHQQVKADLVEHIWRKFERDEDDNWARISFILLIFVFMFSYFKTYVENFIFWYILLNK